MAFPFPIQTQYTGMWQDSSRDQLPPGSVWNLVDYFPNSLGAPLRKRGGWVYGSPTLGASGAGTLVRSIINAEFSGGTKLCVIDTNHILWTVASLASATSATTSTSAEGQPVFHADKVIYPGGAGGTTVTTYFDGTTIAAITAAPNAGYATVYKDRTLLAKTTAKPRYVYFSAAGDPLTWDQVNSWIEVSHPITGIAALRNMILVFATDRVERIRGTTPPPGTDMALEKVSDVHGCDDSRSIAYWGDSVVYADTQGVYLTDGNSTVDLTEQGGMSNYWRTMLLGYAGVAGNWIVAGTVFRHYYFVSIYNGVNLVDTLVCDLPNRAWFRMSNFSFRCFAVVKGTFQDLYGGFLFSPRIARLTDCFTPAAANKNDGDGTAVTPVVEYPMARGFIRVRRRWFPSQGISNWRRMYLSYDLRDSAFPAPGLLDDFSGTLGSWTNNQFSDGALTIIGGAVAGVVTPAWGGGVWTTGFNADCEASALINAIGASGEHFALWARCTNSGATPTGYNLLVQAVGGVWTLNKVVAGVTTQLASGTRVPANGDTFGIQALGSTISAWYTPSGGVQTQLTSLTNSDITAAGKIGLEVFGQTWRLDNFSGGNVAGSGSAPALRMSYVQTPEANAYTDMVPDLAASTAETRGARSFGVSGARGGKTSRSMIGIKVTQVNASSDTRIYDLEGLYQVQGVGKLAQS